MSKMSFKDKLNAKREQIAEHRSAGVRAYKFKPGRTQFVLLPDAKGGDFDRPFSQMYLRNFDGKVIAVVGCRKNTFDEDDAIRDAIWQAIAESGNNEKLVEHYKKMLGRRARIVNALILNDPNQKADEPVLLEFSEKQFDDILKQYEFRIDDMDPEEAEDYDPMDLKKLQVLICERVGTGVNDTEYTYSASTKAHKAPAGVLEKCVDLDGYVAAAFTKDNVDRATKAIATINGIAGLSTTISGVLTGPSSGNTPKQIGGNDDTVTEILDDDIEDAEIEEIAADLEEDDTSPPFDDEDEVKRDDAEEAVDATSDDEDDEEAALLAQLEAARKKKAAAAQKAAKATTATKSKKDQAPVADNDDDDIDLGDDDLNELLAQIG